MFGASIPRLWRAQICTIRAATFVWTYTTCLIILCYNTVVFYLMTKVLIMKHLIKLDISYKDLKYFSLPITSNFIKLIQKAINTFPKTLSRITI